MKKIALVGRMCSGKSTVARKLSQKFTGSGFAVYNLALGNAVKEHYNQLFRRHNFFTNDKPRKQLIQFAQKMREVDENVWINALMEEMNPIEKINKYREDEIVIIVDDVRQYNEYERLSKEGFAFYRIDVGLVTQLGRIDKEYGAYAEEHVEMIEHITENQVTLYREDKFKGTYDSCAMSADSIASSIVSDFSKK